MMSIGQTRWYLCGADICVVRDVFTGEPYKSKLLRCEYAQYDGRDFSWIECPEGSEFKDMKALATVERAVQAA